jgi:hypothetical protein
MTATASVVQWRAAKKGALKGAPFLLAQMEDEEDYSLEARPEGPRQGITVRMSVELFDDVVFLTELMNTFDKLKGVKGGKKWKKASVALLWIQAGRDRWAKRMGGSLPAPEDRKAYLRDAKKHFEELRALEAAAKSKK